MDGGETLDRTVGELHGRLHGVEAALGELRREITNDILDVRTELRATVVDMRAEMAALRRLIWGVMIAALLGPITAALLAVVASGHHVTP